MFSGGFYFRRVSLILEIFETGAALRSDFSKSGPPGLIFGKLYLRANSGCEFRHHATLAPNNGRGREIDGVIGAAYEVS